MHLEPCCGSHPSFGKGGCSRANTCVVGKYTHQTALDNAAIESEVWSHGHVDARQATGSKTYDFKAERDRCGHTEDGRAKVSPAFSRNRWKLRDFHFLCFNLYIDQLVYYLSMPIPATGARERFKGAALTLLRQGGLSAAGLNEVVTLAHAPKGSLYHYFPAGKLQLVSEALDDYREVVTRRISESLKGRDGLRVRVSRLFRSVENQMAETGFSQSCAVGAVVLDLRPEDDDLRQVCELVLAEWAMVAAQHLHELPEVQRTTAGRVMVTLLEGAQLAARAARNGSPLREAAEVFLMYADALMKSPNGRLKRDEVVRRRNA